MTTCPHCTNGTVTLFSSSHPCEECGGTGNALYREVEQRMIESVERDVLASIGFTPHDPWADEFVTYRPVDVEASMSAPAPDPDPYDLSTLRGPGIEPPKNFLGWVDAAPENENGPDPGEDDEERAALDRAFGRVPPGDTSAWGTWRGMFEAGWRAAMAWLDEGDDPVAHDFRAEDDSITLLDENGDELVTKLTHEMAGQLGGWWEREGRALVAARKRSFRGKGMNVAWVDEADVTAHEIGHMLGATNVAWAYYRCAEADAQRVYNYLLDHNMMFTESELQSRLGMGPDRTGIVLDLLRSRDLVVREGTSWVATYEPEP